MDDLIDNPLIMIPLAVILIIIAGAGLITGIQIFDLTFQPAVIVSIDGKEIYRGSNACIEETSLGAATHVQIGRGPLCLFPGPKYTSKNVTTKPE